MMRQRFCRWLNDWFDARVAGLVFGSVVGGGEQMAALLRASISDALTTRHNAQVIANEIDRLRRESGKGTLGATVEWLRRMRSTSARSDANAEGARHE